MRICVWTGHVGSNGLKPSGQHGGGELHTFAFLSILNKYYDVTAIVQNGVYPAFDQNEYGLDLSDLNWKPVGNSADWTRQFDCLISINHAMMAPPIARRNILVTFFPQYPDWDTSGYDTIIANSEYTAKWIKQYWGRGSHVIYPPVPLQDIKPLEKKKLIVCVGRFFQVPFGNNKNHQIVLDAFKEMMLPDWQLAFVGAVQDPNYYKMVRAAAGNDERIKFYHNLDRTNYLKLLGQADFVWSATGYEAPKPSAKEHFGIFSVEAMAAGAIPMVYDDGGTPETGCLTWQTVDQLIEETRRLTQCDRERKKLSKGMIKLAKSFDISNREKELIKVIEEPIVIYNDKDQFKTYVGDPRPQDIKVGIWSDSPTRTLGFATVTRALITGLRKRGFRLTVLGMQDDVDGSPQLAPPDIERIVRDTLKQSEANTADQLTDQIMDEIYKIEPCTIWRGLPGDQQWSNLKEWLETEKPDVLYLNYDPGNVRLMIDHLRRVRCELPLICYIPIEGKPVIEPFVEFLRIVKVLNGQTIVYTNWAREAIKESGGPVCKVAHHGGDHANFRPLDEETRQTLRFAIGWQNKFVLMFVGRNKRTKGFGAIFHTAKILKEAGHKQFLWYLHTDPNDRISNSSLPLWEMAKSFGIDDVILFPPDLHSQPAGIPYEGPINRGQVPDTDDIREIWNHNLSTLSLIERYGCADMFVNLSEMEGFGLPALEAMGCGLPVISVDDEGNQREVLGGAPAYIPVKHWDTTFMTGGALAQVDPGDVARAILDISQRGELLGELRGASLRQWQKFKWDDMVDIIAQTIIEQYI